ncbi:hypothetical protein KI387_030759, partial [Taxus chinensis]
MSGRVGRENPNWRKEGKNCLSLVSCGLGHPDQKYARDVDRLVWRKSVHFGGSGIFVPE